MDQIKGGRIVLPTYRTSLRRQYRDTKMPEIKNIYTWCLIGGPCDGQMLEADTPPTDIIDVLQRSPIFVVPEVGKVGKRTMRKHPYRRSSFAVDATTTIHFYRGASLSVKDALMKLLAAYVPAPKSKVVT